MIEPFQHFVKEAQKYENRGKTIIELGTRRWHEKPTHHKDLWPNLNHIGVDFMDGLDVDRVADAHALSKVFGENSVDYIYSSSVLEHVHSPWIVADEILKTLKPGGLFYLDTCQAFPIHGYPNFYYCFSDEGLKHLFKNAKDIVTGYDYPCKVIPNVPISNWNHMAKAYLLVKIIGAK